ncbi:MAG: tetratricopeptide repeat protein [bacterium]|nr:tetratricopeptide repeat protein [bacterium]
MENSNTGEITLNAIGSIENVKPYLANNDKEGAKQFLNEFLKINPGHSQAMFILAQLMEVDENYVEAAALYEKVFDTNIPPELSDRVLMVYESADRYDKVYDIYKKQYNADKNNADVCERYAHACCILKKYEEAIEAYNSVLAQQPENIVALKQLAEIYEQTNQMMFRLTNAKIAVIEQDYEKAEKDYKKAFSLAEKDEDVIQIKYQLAKMYRQIGKNELALDEYLFILSATEENFKIFLELAEIYIELNNQFSAINVLKRALHVYPDNVEAMQMLADTYLDSEDYNKAQEYYEKLVELSGDVENKVNLAKVYLQLDNMDKTKEVLVSAEKQEPNSTEVLTALAGYYTYISDFEQAKAYCNKIIQKLPKSPLGYRKLAQMYEAQGENHLAHYNYGVFHELKGETDEAINEYSQALNYRKDDFETVKRLANLHESVGEVDAAADCYHTLFEAKIDFVETTKKLVNIYLNMKEYDMAQRYIDAATKEDDNVELKFLSAKCMYKVKDYEGALEALQYYKEHTKSLENEDETNKLIAEIEDKMEKGSNPLGWLFRFLDK